MTTDADRPLSISPTTLARVLAGWSDSSGALYRSLADAVVAAIERGDLPTGARLPAERAAAPQLGVSRGTMVAAYDALRDAGVVDRRRGSGTWIVGPHASAFRVAELAAGLRARQLTRHTVTEAPAVIDLALSVLPAPDGLPPEAFELDPTRLVRLAHGHGYHPPGLPALRERLAELHTERGVPTDPDQILVTTGAQQALSLVAQHLVAPGDVVAVEAPTYPGAIDVWSRVGARFAALAGDSAGVVPAHVRRIVDEQVPEVVYVVPTGQNPRGTVVPPARRRELAAIADRAACWLVEDEALAWTVHDGAGPPLPIAAFATGGRVLTLGSLSKLFWGGLRLGWVRGDAATISQLGRLKAALDLGSDSLTQAVALSLLDRVDEIAAVRRRALASSARLVTGLLADRLPDWQVRPPEAGLSLWVRLPGGDADDLATVALRHGVRVLPGTAASPVESAAPHLRLAISLPPAQLREAVDRLAAAWHSADRSPTSVPSAR